MPKHLLIVESPAKAKTIEKYLGQDFTVKSSYGHIRDLEKNDGAVDIANNFAPRYVISPDKQKVVKELKDSLKKVDEVWLATDEDREGEAISWHLCQVLGLDERQTKRIVFREITKPAIQRAIQQPRRLDLNLVDAQQARRILDRLVGYELSGVLWKKIRGRLSAGRVQSVALKLVVEREREITQFRSVSFYKITATFSVKNEQGREVALQAEAPARFDAEKDALDYLNRCNGANFKIDNIELRPLKRRPAAPFTTSTLQQEASRKLGFSVNRTMSVAQRLYEAGHITYMRTDSTNLSDLAMQAVAQEIEKQYGKSYLQTRQYKNKVANAQEAHEAIRPTYIDHHQISADRDEQRLYELIWKRTIASQMSDALLEKTVVKIGISTMPGEHLVAEGEVLKFDGFLKVYLESKDDDDEEESKGMLPPLKVAQVLPLQRMNATERFTRPPARYTEASLVKRLEELGIGRPSTYAPTISRIMEEGRGYVVKANREGTPRSYKVWLLQDGKIAEQTESEVTGAIVNRLMPTDMGIMVSDFLDEHFKEIMDYRFTAEIEKQFDDISNGNRQWTDMLSAFYQPFHQVVENTLEKADRPYLERILGKDPTTGYTLLTRMSRNGPVIQIGAPDELLPDEKPRYANLQPGQSIETITYEEALKLFQLPRQMEAHQGQEVSIGTGRFGPYIKFGEKYISLPRGEDPLSITRERAIELIEQKMREDAPVTTYKGEPVVKGKGRFGPYIKWRDIFINVPKKYDFERLTPMQMHELIEAKVQKEANRYIQRWESEGIDIENGRWGPFIRFGKQMISFPRKNGEKVSAEAAANMTLEEVKALITAQIPDAFEKKSKTKKSTTKTSAPKKASTTKTIKKAK